MGKFKVSSNNLVPKHSKVSEGELKKLLEQHMIVVKDLPKILKTDPVVEELGVQPGEVIKIIRKSEITGESVYYRVVISG